MDDRNTENLNSRIDPAEQEARPSTGESMIYSGTPSRGGNGRHVGEFNVQLAIRAMIRHWRIFILCVIVGLTLGVLYAQFATKIYRAEAVLEMNVQRPRVINNAAVFDDLETSRDTDAIFNTRFEKFKSPAMEELATKEFFERYPKSDTLNHPTGINSNSLAALIRSDVKWSKDPDANIVRVAYESESPRFAANLVNVLSVCAGELMIAENRALSDEAVKWLVVQVEEQRESLEEVEEQLSGLREEVKIDNLQQRKTALQQAIMSVSGEREELISKLAERETVYEFVSGLQDIDPKLVTLPSGFPKEDQLNELIRAWRVAYDDFEQIAGRYTEVHPEYRLAQEKEERARQRLNQFIEISAKTVENEINLLERQMDQLNRRIDSMKREALLLEQDLTTGMQQVLQLERKRDAADNSYQDMLRRMAEARASADDNMAFTKVIRQAAVPENPVKPRTPVVLIVSIAFSGFLGLAIAVFIEFWQDTIASVDELRAMNLKILGVIPSQKNMDLRGELATIGLRDRFNPIVEMFAGINALFSSGRYQNRTKMLLISSVMPGEGKTIASCNLAISSALNGMRTLLIDADLRRPQFMHVFAIGEEHPSLLEWLKGAGADLSCEELVCTGVLENLDVIFSRPLADTNPAELLGRGHLAELLAWARKHYDRIIIDSPPFGPVGDAHILSNLSDGVILVTRIGVTRRRLLKYGLNRMAQTDALLLGCIVNDVPKTLAGMFGGAEGYGYSYGYSYSSRKSD